jgi:hypothetical protein
MIDIKRAEASARHGVQPGTIARNAAAGLIATGAMTVVMGLGKAIGLMGTAPPREITKRGERKSGANPNQQSRETFDTTWLAAHAAFGSGSGVVYGLLQGVLPKSEPVAGLTYGLALWGASYLGLMPALGLYPWPDQDRNSRVAVMIAAHVVYGEALAALVGGGGE